mmetsp:Transcript_11492/g.14388  ORF Transcript_11492/g.14388 Transcript_11492/m.14388 type:complete len:215 (-) Transcript_11492:24-668(-)
MTSLNTNREEMTEKSTDTRAALTSMKDTTEDLVLDVAADRRRRATERATGAKMMISRKRSRPLKALKAKRRRTRRLSPLRRRSPNPRRRPSTTRRSAASVRKKRRSRLSTITWLLARLLESRLKCVKLKNSLRRMSLREATSRTPELLPNSLTFCSTTLDRARLRKPSFSDSRLVLTTISKMTAEVVEADVAVDAETVAETARRPVARAPEVAR